HTDRTRAVRSERIQSADRFQTQSKSLPNRKSTAGSQMESHTIAQDEQRTRETRASIYLPTPLPASPKPTMKFARTTWHDQSFRSVEMDESTATLPFGQHGTQKT